MCCHYTQLMLITQKNDRSLDDYLSFISSCVEYGITSLQLREKELSYQELFDFGRQLQSILVPYKIPLIINDNIRLAQALDADGVHLGQGDGDPLMARQQLGDEKLIGVSINTYDELIIANTLPINYVGIGAIFPTQSKKNIQTLWGLETLQKASESSTHPVVAIGGINEKNAASVIAVGAEGISVIAAIHDAVNIKATIEQLLAVTQVNKDHRV